MPGVLVGGSTFETVCGAFAGGAPGIVLGVLAAIGIAPVTLSCIAPIALGGGLLLGGPGEVELERFVPESRPRPGMAHALRASAGVMAVAGAVAAVLYLKPV